MYKPFKSHSHSIQQRWSRQEYSGLRWLLNHYISQWLTHWLRSAWHQPAESLGRSMLTASSIQGSSCSFGYGLSPYCNKHVAVPQPQLRQAQKLSQTYPSFVLWTTLFHGLLNRIPKMLAEHASFYSGLEKPESDRRKPNMNTNRRSLKESFNSSGEWIVFMFLIKVAI